jgi:CheY-like chemotaxis protein
MPHRSKLKIFLADDLADRRACAKHQLENMGYAAVFSFASPDACLKRLPLRPDLVLLPVPVKSPQGLDLQRRIRAFNRRTMVMYIGDAPETQLEAAMRRAEKTCSYRRLKEAIVRKIKAITAMVTPAKQA